MSHFVAYILQFQEIIVYKIPPGGGGGSIASLRSRIVWLICYKLLKYFSGISRNLQVTVAMVMYGSR